MSTPNPTLSTSVSAIFAESGQHSAPVTHIGQRIVWTIVTLLAMCGIYWLMWRGWKNRQARQADVPSLPAGPEGFAVPDDFFVTYDAVEATYVSTTSEGDWLDRIAVHGLGDRSQARVAGGPPGVWIEREPFGAPDVFIPATAIRGVRLATGMAGKYLHDEGIVVVTWQHGERLLDTGVKPRHEADRAVLVAAIEQISTGPVAVSAGAESEGQTS